MKITMNGNSRLIGGVSAISSASPVEVHDNRKTANTDGPWKALFFRTAIAANCLPSSFVDANDHVIKAIDALRVAPVAPSAPASPAIGIEVELVRDKVYGSMNIRKWTAIGELSEGKHTFMQASRATPAEHGEDKGYWIQGGRKHYVGPAIKPADHSSMPSKETVKRLFNMHGGPVDGEGWCLNENGLNDFLRDLFGSRPA